MNAAGLEPPPLLSVRELVMGCRAAKVVFTAAKLDLFTALGEERLAAGELARRLGLARGPLEVLLDALAAVGWLSKQGDHYANTSLGRRLLVEGSVEFVGESLARMDAVWGVWSALGAVLRRGRPPRGGAGLLAGPAQEPLRRAQAAELSALSSCSFLPGRLLDLSSCSPEFSLAFLRRYPALRGDLVAPASVVREARRRLRKEPCRLRARLNLRAGDPARAALGSGLYDVALVSQLTHRLPEERNAALFKRLAAALRPGGRAIVHDVMLGPTRTSPVFDALYSAEVALLTGVGHLYTTEDCARWLGEAGLSLSRRLDLSGSNLHAAQALIAERAG